jgi:hypothetical protein
MQEAYQKAVRTILASGKYDPRRKDLQEGVTVTQAWRDGMSNLGKDPSGAEQEKQAAEKIGKKLNDMARGSSSGSGERWTFFTVYEMAFPMDDPYGIKDATPSSQMIDSGQPQGGVTLAEMMGDNTMARALEEYQRLILIGPQRLVRAENDTDVPQGYYKLGEGAPIPFEGAKDPDRVAVHVVELYDSDKMSLEREDEQPAYDDWPEAVQVGHRMPWPAPLLLPPARQTVTQQPRQVDHQREAERFKKQNQAYLKEIKELKKQVRSHERAAKKKAQKSKKPRTQKTREERQYTDVQTATEAHQEEQRRRRGEKALKELRLG